VKRRTCGPRAGWADREAIELDSLPVPDKNLDRRMVKHVCGKAKGVADARDLLVVLGLMDVAREMKEEHRG
jgi:hypothetical protein